MRIGAVADDFTGATDIAGFPNALRWLQENGPTSFYSRRA